MFIKSSATYIVSTCCQYNQDICAETLYNLSGRNITDTSLCVGAMTELRKTEDIRSKDNRQHTYVAVAIPDSHFGSGNGNPQPGMEILGYGETA